MTAYPLITESKFFHPPYVVCGFEDSRQQLWLGTDRQGVVRVDSAGQKEKLYPLKNIVVRNILEDRDKRLIIATAQTVFLWDRESDNLVPLSYSGKRKIFVFIQLHLRMMGISCWAPTGKGLCV